MKKEKLAAPRGLLLTHSIVETDENGYSGSNYGDNVDTHDASLPLALSALRELCALRAAGDVAALTACLWSNAFICDSGVRLLGRSATHVMCYSLRPSLRAERTSEQRAAERNGRQRAKEAPKTAFIAAQRRAVSSGDDEKMVAVQTDYVLNLIEQIEEGAQADAEVVKSAKLIGAVDLGRKADVATVLMCLFVFLPTNIR